MPEDLVQELETAPSPVVVSLENVEDLLRVVVRDVSCAVKGMKGSALTFQNGWRRIVLDVAKGRTTEMQALRPRLLNAIEMRLSLLEQTLALARWLHELGKAHVPDPEVLMPEIIDLKRLKADVFDHWQTADDLERLAVEHYPLSQARLEQIAATHEPPQEWYQGEEERLFQE